jgi:hypothetical protein
MLFLCETLSLGVLVAENILRHKVTKTLRLTKNQIADVFGKAL